ncbi:MAG: hypothetical protein NAOJABEB_00816 [Steroidobacteraceae bacterium]|nr:hypothetical protein [Steroidobacteraceae bacterium]
MTTRTLTGPFALAAFLCFTAFAAGAAELPAKTVFYGDLNLSSPAGAGVLYARIKAAAKQVCPGYGERTISARDARNACIAQTVDKAVADVNRPLLSALHKSSSTIRTASR